VAGLACAGALLLAFAVIEVTGSRPLIPPALFRLRGLRVGNLLMLGMGATMTAAFFFLSLYLQEALGYSALRAGLALLPTTVVMVAAGLASSRLIPVIGSRLLLLAGGLITAAALAWLTGLPAHSAYPVHVLGPAVLAGIGMGLMLLPTTLASTNGVPVRDAGAAAGLLNSARQVGGALGLAALVTIAATATRHDVAHAGYLAGLVHGYHVAFGVAAVIMVAAGLLALALPAAAAATRQDGKDA
jgi:predicted MFS family arabinose efflux permease